MRGGKREEENEKTRLTSQEFPGASSFHIRKTLMSLPMVWHVRPCPGPATSTATAVPQSSASLAAPGGGTPVVAPFQVCSLDEFGTVVVWTVTQVEPSSWSGEQGCSR